jgi:hypothetical protein
MVFLDQTSDRLCSSVEEAENLVALTGIQNTLPLRGLYGWNLIAWLQYEHSIAIFQIDPLVASSLSRQKKC